jgi:hypothetical protein
MELFKFISETEIQKYKGGFVVIDNRIYTNPTEETVRKAGYKKLIDGPIPEHNPETEYIETTYTDGTDIVAVHTIKAIPAE